MRSILFALKLSFKKTKFLCTVLLLVIFALHSLRRLSSGGRARTRVDLVLYLQVFSSSPEIPGHGEACQRDRHSTALQGIRRWIQGWRQVRWSRAGWNHAYVDTLSGPRNWRWQTRGISSFLCFFAF